MFSHIPLGALIVLMVKYHPLKNSVENRNAWIAWWEDSDTSSNVNLQLNFLPDVTEYISFGQELLTAFTSLKTLKEFVQLSILVL